MTTWSAKDAQSAFDHALTLGESDRHRFLLELRAKDTTLADEVESLLAYHTRASGMLDAPAIGAANGMGTSGSAEELPAGTVLGRYTIKREIGRGGMGIVYEATQDHPRRDVALKLIRSDIVSLAAMRRFQHEADTLGLLQHPGIAQAYDAGVFRDPHRGTEGLNRPYMAMELIAGVTLSQWMKETKPSIRDRVIFMIRVCEAIEHAHKRGVIHRDIKPGNIMVDSQGLPKVLDFGVSRLAEQTTGQTLATTTGQIIGTLRYMSPEQASGDPARIDNRTDIYSLGAVLYELLTEKPAIDTEGVSVPEAVRRVSESIPIPPGRIVPTLRGDIETIVLHALAKQPDKRYQHAAALRDDLQHWLNDEPISVRPPTLVEQFTRLVRRNRAVAAGVGIGLVMLLIGSGLAVWQAVRATRSAEIAKQETEVSRDTLQIMARIIESGTPDQLMGKDISVREMLMTASNDIRSHPDTLATARACSMLSNALENAGDYEAAELHARRAVSIDIKLRGPDARETLEDQIALATALGRLDREDEGLKLARETHASALRKYGPEDDLTIAAMVNLAYSLPSTTKEARDEGLDLLQRAAALSERIHGADDDRTLNVKHDLAVTLDIHEKHAEAEALLRAILARRVERLTDLHPSCIKTRDSLSVTLMHQSKIEAAKEQLVLASGHAQKVFGPEHPATLRLRNMLTQTAAMAGDLQLAEKEARLVWEARKHRLGRTHRDTLNSQGLLVNCLIGLKRIDDAEVLGREVVKLTTETYGASDDDTHTALTLVFDICEAKGDTKGMMNVWEQLKDTRLGPSVRKYLESKNMLPPQTSKP